MNPSQTIPIRNVYEEMGVEQFYKKHAWDYQNPHASTIATLIDQAKERGLIGQHVLDLCCGSGEITHQLTGHHVMGIDPYTHQVYEHRTGKKP